MQMMWWENDRPHPLQPRRMRGGRAWPEIRTVEGCVVKRGRKPNPAPKFSKTFEEAKECRHVIFVSPEGIKCAWCDYGMKMEPLGHEFAKVLFDNLRDLYVKT